MNHTKEPWYAIQNPIWGNADYRISNKENDNWVAFGQIAYASEYNARRIVACVNACAGFTNEELKKGVQLKGSTKIEKLLDQLTKLEKEIEKDLNNSYVIGYKECVRDIKEFLTKEKQNEN